MKIPEALSVLGLAELVSPAALRQVYRKKARTLHPDGGGSSAEFSRLYDAYKAADTAALDAPCDHCRGSGRIDVKGGLRLPCAHCGGTGKKW